MRLFSLGLVVAAMTVAAVLSARGLPAGHARHLLLYIGAGAAWAAAVQLWPRLPRGGRDKLVIVVLAVAMRVPAWWGTPAHSDDLHRYLWDGRVQRAGINPYLHPPDAPELAGLRDGAAVARLPAEEREACRKLWDEVARVLKRAGGPR